jgi:hypothetical protein
MTQSNDFPTTNDAYQQNYNDDYDIFISKFSSSGSLIYSSYLGTSGYDRIRDCELEVSGNMLISGQTNSSNFPTTDDAEQESFNGYLDGFLMRISPDLEILYSTFIGGSNYDSIASIAIDTQGNIIVTGATTSFDFPLTDTAYQNSVSGTERDFYVAKYNSEGQLMYATYFGGSDMDDCFGVGVDSYGNMIATGRTWSSDFPTANAYQETYSEIQVDGFVTKLSNDGQELTFSSYFGGTAWDTIHHVSVDSKDNIIVSGTGGTDGIPIINAIQEDFGGTYDIVIMVISPDGKPQFSSYLGGSGGDHPWNQYFSDGKQYIVGMTTSSDFLVSDTAHQLEYSRAVDGFIFRFDVNSYLKAM